MKRYEVITTALVFGINDGSNGKKEYILKQGDIVELPETNITVTALTSRGQIREAPSIKDSKKTNNNQPDPA